MDMLRAFDVRLSKWMDRNNPKHWEMVKLKKMRSDKITSNLAESVNARLKTGATS